MNKINELIDILAEAVIQRVDEKLKTLDGIINITNPVEIKDKIKEVWNLFNISYKGRVIGGQNHRTLNKNTDFLTVVYENGNIIASAAYRTDLGGKKMFLIGCDQTSEGKSALRKIIKRDIKEFNCNYWVEASGPIEHYFKKNAGFPIPNIYAEYLLGKSGLSLNADGFHYCRTIDGDSGYEKIIFGFRDKDFYKKVMTDIEDYGELRQIFLSENDYSGKYEDIIQRALFFVNRIDEYYDNGFTEMTPFMHKSLLNAVNILSRQPKDITINSSLKHANFLLQNMPVIQLHKL